MTRARCTCSRGQPAVRAVRVEDDAVLEREAEVAHGGVAAQVLVGQEQHLARAPDAAALVERPLQRGPGVAGGADRAAVAAGERLDRRGGVHVGHRHDVVRHAHVDEVVPRVVDLADRGHVGHRAAGRQVGQDHLLPVVGEDVGRLGHEVHTAEDDVRRVRPRGCLLGQLEGVTGDVGELDHLVALVVVAEDEDPVPERGLGGAGPLDQAGVGGGRQVAGALDTTLAGQVATRAQDQQRQGGVDGAAGRQIRDCAHPAIVPHAPPHLAGNLPVPDGPRRQTCRFCAAPAPNPGSALPR